MYEIAKEASLTFQFKEIFNLHIYTLKKGEHNFK